MLRYFFTISFPASYSHQSTGFRSILPDKNEAPRSSLLRRSSHFGYEGRKQRGMRRRSIKARARRPSRWGTIFRPVRGMYNPRNLGSLKRAAPLRLSCCCGAPFLDSARLGACLDLNTEKPPRRVTKNTCCDRMDSARRWWENYVGTRELRGSTRVAQQQNTPAGCSRLSSAALPSLSTSL
jgi:hypothetical protein